MTSDCILPFQSLYCKKGEHNSCCGEWYGLGFEFDCECICHAKENDVAGGFGMPASATSSQFSSEVTNDKDLY